MKPTKAMTDAFKEGYQNPGAPLSDGEMRLIYRAVHGEPAGPRLVFSEDVETPAIQAGEISHTPYAGDEEVIDAEIVEPEL